MSINTMTATSVRNDFFDVLDQVLSGKTILVTRDDEEVAVISPRKRKTNWVGLRQAMLGAKGVWKDDLNLDSPIRGKQSTDKLGKFDEK